MRKGDDAMLCKGGKFSTACTNVPHTLENVCEGLCIMLQHLTRSSEIFSVHCLEDAIYLIILRSQLWIKTETLQHGHLIFEIIIRFMI